MANQIGWKTNRSGVRMTECQNCGRLASENGIEPVIGDIWARVEPGEIMPAGECRSCGGLAHLIPLFKPSRKEAA